MITPRWLVRWLDVPLRNPAFPIDYRDAEREFARMSADPKPALARPVLVLAGWRAWAMMPRGIARDLRRLTGVGPDAFLPIAFPLSSDIPSIATEVCRNVERRWPSSDERWTVEVDVVAVSMGGLVARAAAGERTRAGPCKRLRIARLFTIGSPHRGAKLAERVRIDAASRQMRPGSAFLRLLDEELARAEYELICYARLRDNWVGARRSAPHGRHPHWVSGQRILSHNLITQDRRIIADIARRLRGETPLATDGGEPPVD
ncbi:MAG: esterase/lipase family protein [Phycisphaerales bacterium]